MTIKYVGILVQTPEGVTHDPTLSEKATSKIKEVVKTNPTIFDDPACNALDKVLPICECLVISRDEVSIFGKHTRRSLKDSYGLLEHLCGKLGTDTCYVICSPKLWAELGDNITEWLVYDTTQEEPDWHTEWVDVTAFGVEYTNSPDGIMYRRFTKRETE